MQEIDYIDYIFEIREASVQDINTVYGLVLELVQYQQLNYKFCGSLNDFKKYTIGKDKVASVYCGWLVHKKETQTSIMVGYTLHYLNYSSFYLKPGIYLEDIYVKSKFRGLGYGKKLISNLCDIAKLNSYCYVELQVIESNHSSIKIYEFLKFKPVNGWIQYRLESSYFESLNSTLSNS